MSNAAQKLTYDQDTSSTSTSTSQLQLVAPGHGFSATIVELNTQGALLHSQSRGAVKVGQIIGTVNILVNGEKVASVPQVIVKQTRPVEDGALIGVTFETSIHSDMYNNERVSDRSRVRQPTDARVVVRHPVNQADDVHFRVDDVSPNGMKLSTSLRNRFILPEMMFKDATASLGQFAEFHFDFSTVHCRSDESSNRLVVGVKFESLTDLAKQTLAGFLITNQGEALDENQTNSVAYQMKPRRVNDVVRYTLATTMQHFMDLQMMRWRANLSNGKIDPHKTTPQNMLDQFDQRSKIILGYVGEELVCSVRLTSCESEDDRFEVDSLVNLENRYERTNTMEISRAWIIPELHNTEIVHGMIEFVAKTFAESSREWLVTSCKPDMFKFYERMGFRNTGYQYQSGGQTYLVIEISSVRSILPTGTSPVRWAYTYARVNEFLISRGYAKNNWFTAKKLSIFRKIAAIAMNLMNKKTGEAKALPAQT